MTERSAWPSVRLGAVVAYRKDPVTIDDLATYKRPRVQLHAQGIVLRDEILGAAIKTKKQQVCHTGDFLVAEIDAKVGGFGIVPESLDGSIVSSHYFLYAIDETKLHRSFLDYFMRTPAFREQVEAQGSTNYAAIRPSDVLGYEIPLPPLAEQRRIVARIEGLAALVDEARALRQQASAGGNQTLLCMAHRLDLSDGEKHSCGWRRMRLAECIRLSNDTHRVDAGRVYPNLGIYSFGRGLFHKPALEGATISATTLRRVSAGQFIYSRLFAFEGAYGTVDAEFDARFVSAEYPTFDCNPEVVRVEFLNAYFLASSVWQAVAVGSKGLGDRRQRVQPTQVLDYVAWIPPMAWQNRIAEARRKLLTLQPIQAETAAELDALLPSILDRAFKGKL